MSISNFVFSETYKPPPDLSDLESLIKTSDSENKLEPYTNIEPPLSTKLQEIKFVE